MREKFSFPINKPYDDLNDEEKKILWTGNEHFIGLKALKLERKNYKIQIVYYYQDIEERHYVIFAMEVD